MFSTGPFEDRSCQIRSFRFRGADGLTKLGVILSVSLPLSLKTFDRWRALCAEFAAGGTSELYARVYKKQLRGACHHGKNGHAAHVRFCAARKFVSVSKVTWSCTGRERRWVTWSLTDSGDVFLRKITASQPQWVQHVMQGVWCK